jgi:hypothetical protein
MCVGFVCWVGNAATNNLIIQLTAMAGTVNGLFGKAETAERERSPSIFYRPGKSSHLFIRDSSGTVMR